MTRVSTPRTGMTLIEIMVAMAVFLLVTTAALNFMLPSLHRFATSDVSFDAQRQALTATMQIAADLRESSASLIQFGVTSGLPATTYVVIPAGGGATMAMAIPTARDVTGAFALVSTVNPTPMPGTVPTGAPSWVGWIQYWGVPDPADSSPTTPTFKLYRRLYYPSGGFTATAANAALSSLSTAPPGRLICGGVSLLQLQALSYTVGLGRFQVTVKTLRYYNYAATTFEGDKTVELLY